MTRERTTYLRAERPEVKPSTSKSQVQPLNHYTTRPSPRSLH